MEQNEVAYNGKKLEELTKSTFLIKLKSMGLLTQEEVQRIDKEDEKAGDIRAMALMYGIVVGRPGSYANLKQALQEARQLGAVKTLESIPSVVDNDEASSQGGETREPKHNTTKRMVTKSSKTKNDLETKPSASKRSSTAENSAKVPTKRQRKEGTTEAALKPLVMGSEKCSIEAVVRDFEKSTLSAIFVEGWTTLARNLETSGAKVEIIRKSLLLDKIDHFGALTQLLTGWITDNSKKATLNEFIRILNSMKWKHFADELPDKFISD